MNETLFFILATVLLLALVLFFFIPPLLRGTQSLQHASERKLTNLAIFRDQQSELLAEHSAGTLSDTDFQSSQNELNKRLLEEVQDNNRVGEGEHQAARGHAFVLAVSLPAVALLGYLWLGNPQALNPQARQPVTENQFSPADMAAMVEKLAARMAQNPDDKEGWIMLARSYRLLNQHDKAAAVFAKLPEVVNQDPELLCSYAESLAVVNNGVLQGQPRALIQQALTLNSKHPHALFLAGAAALEAGELQNARDYWQTLLPLIQEQSDLAKVLENGVNSINEELKAPHQATPDAHGKTTAQPSAAPVPAAKQP